MDSNKRYVILSWRAVIVTFTLSLIIREASSQTQVEQSLLKKILNESYDRKIRPTSRDNASAPTVVTVNLYVRSMDNIDEYKMEYDVQLTYRESWTDPRLAYNTQADLPYITLTDVELVWRPDTFFSNEKQAHRHDLMVPNNYVRIYPDGLILYSTRISLTLRCPMYLALFPFDQQSCSIRLASYGYTTKNIQFEWKKDDPVQITPTLALARFSLESFTPDRCDSETNTGVYSCLRLEFLLSRSINYYLLHVYIPCLNQVIVSWLSFWLDRKAINGRILLTVSTLFVMSIGVSNFNKLLPPVSYTKSIDVFTGTCLTFVFASLVQSVVANYLARSEEAEAEAKDLKSQQSSPDNIPLTPIACTPGNGEGAVEALGGSGGGGNNRILKRFGKYWTRFETPSQRIDGFSRVLFPAAFLLFNIFYWI